VAFCIINSLITVATEESGAMYSAEKALLAGEYLTMQQLV
jgi:hypothetical protein